MSLRDKLRQSVKDTVQKSNTKGKQIVSDKAIEVIEDIHLSLIIAKKQIRTEFDEKKIDELAASIDQVGLIQPIVVQKKGKKYEIVAGERRFRAFKKLSKKSIKAIVRDFSQSTNTKLAQLIENIQREDISPIDEANAYQELLNETKCSHAELAKRIGKSKARVTNTIKILRLVEKVESNNNIGSTSNRLNDLKRSVLEEMSGIVNEPFFLTIYEKDLTDITIKELRNIIKKEKEKLNLSNLEKSKRKKELKDKYERIIGTAKVLKGEVVKFMFAADNTTTSSDGNMQLLGIPEMNKWVETINRELQNISELISTINNQTVSFDANITFRTVDGGSKEIEKIGNVSISEKQDLPDDTFPQFGYIPYTNATLSTNYNINTNTIKVLSKISNYSFINYRADEAFVYKFIVDRIPRLNKKIFEDDDIDLMTFIDQWNALPWQKVDKLAGFFYKACKQPYSLPSHYLDLKERAFRNLEEIEKLETDDKIAEMRAANRVWYDETIIKYLGSKYVDLTIPQHKMEFYAAIEQSYKILTGESLENEKPKK